MRSLMCLKLFSITDFSPERSNREEAFKYTCSFVGDENTYYVNNENQIVWYDNYANPIVRRITRVNG